MAKPVFVFIDESGNLDFSDRGTRYFVLSAVVTDDPIHCGRELSTLTYEFLARGLIDQIPFHATENSRGTRKRVIETMCREHSCWAYSVTVEKAIVPHLLQTPGEFFAALGGTLGQILVSALNTSHQPVVLLFDSTLTARQRSGFLKAVKPVLNSVGVQYRIAFRSVKDDPNGQIADYHAWSVFRAKEHADSTWLDALPLPHSIHELRKLVLENDHPA